MTLYFEASGSKPVIKSKEVFKSDDIRSDLLYDYYSKNCKPLPRIESRDLYQQWFDRLFYGNYNIVLRGCQSKFQILEEFFIKYLNSGKLPDYNSTTNKGTKLDITTVKLHGFVNVSVQSFIHSLFNITENRSHSENDVETFLDSIRKSKKHFVFLIHSYELFFMDNPIVCDIISQLYSNEPNFIHLILSSDHINSGRILSSSKYSMNYLFYSTLNGHTFFFEKTQSVSIIDQDFDEPIDSNENNKSSNRNTSNILIGQQVSLHTLIDVYSAMQKDCVKIMKFIIEYFIKAAELNDQLIEESENQSVRFGTAGEEKSSNRRLRSSMKAAAQSKSKSKSVIKLDWEDLLSYYEREFIVRRTQVLKGHIGELIDHRIIKLDESETKIQCLLSKSTCENFLKYIASNE